MARGVDTDMAHGNAADGIILGRRIPWILRNMRGVKEGMKTMKGVTEVVMKEVEMVS